MWTRISLFLLVMCQHQLIAVQCVRIPVDCTSSVYTPADAHDVQEEDGAVDDGDNDRQENVQLK